MEIIDPTSQTASDLLATSLFGTKMIIAGVLMLAAMLLYDAWVHKRPDMEPPEIEWPRIWSTFATVMVVLFLAGLVSHLFVLAFSYY